MNNSKNNNKKIIIIGAIVLVILIIIGLFINLKDEKIKQQNDSTISCSFERNLQIMNINIKMKVNYVDDEFKYVEEEYEIELLNEKMIQKKDAFKQELEKSVLEQFEEIDATPSFETTENSIIIKFDMDSKNYELYNENAKSLVGDESLNYSEYFYGAESLQQDIESIGGECQYE